MREFEYADRSKRVTMLYAAAESGNVLLLQAMVVYDAERKLELPSLDIMIDCYLHKKEDYSDVPSLSCFEVDRLLRSGHPKKIGINDLGELLMKAAQFEKLEILTVIIRHERSPQIDDAWIDRSISVAGRNSPSCLQLLLNWDRFNIERHQNGLKDGLNNAIRHGHAQSVAAILKVIPQEERFKPIFVEVSFEINHPRHDKMGLILAAFREYPFFLALATERS